MSTIPKTAPFDDEEIALLNRVVGPRPTQRAWLAGFLAGVEASAAPQPAAPPHPAEPLTIVYASESGNSERLATDMAKAARKIDLKPTIIDMADLEIDRARQGEAAGRSSPPPGARASRRPRRARLWRIDGRGAPRLEGVNSACWRSAIPPMRNSAPSARRSTSGWRRSAASAWSIASIAISISRRLRQMDRARAQGAGAGATPTAARVIEVDFGASRRRGEAEIGRSRDHRA